MVRENKKILVILEQDLRCHITNYARENSDIRSYFASNLYINLKKKKLTNVEQLGRDRIIKFTFGTKQTLQLYLILEMYKTREHLLGLTANLANIGESIVNAATQLFRLKDPLTSLLCDHIPKFNKNWTNEEKMTSMKFKKQIYKHLEVH
ncbi:hypothetical protein RFI_19691 [Reticulomyxa filosa]|uniref:Uncharacterized protein n=1 Tax=Reticulomyxa filosa TaxID=46433 RepID=X6MUV6_RETFI|nr:hypothetical protein RFI_19691 [Reticulomyxa filosa]|eukprot:ETO17629.1 hypothetical protein RFI_19691 [Reticulomyxa filosa]